MVFTNSFAVLNDAQIILHFQANSPNLFFRTDLK